MKIEKINIRTTNNEYSFNIGNGLMKNTGTIIRGLSDATKVLVVTDAKVEALYLNMIADSLKDSGFAVENFVFDGEESLKNLSTYSDLLHHADKWEIGKGDLFLALGGGVVGDITGFAAATYLRGIDFIQVPTTLLSGVDASVGGKNGVNIGNRKNAAGTFKQPLSVICDTQTFSTLPQEEYTNGIGEIIKYGMIRDATLFKELDPKTMDSSLSAIIKACVKIKAEIVEADEFDTGERYLLNFGHTVAHAIERLSNYSIPHGKAVGLGMLVMARAAAKKQLCNEDVPRALIQKLRQFEMPITPHYTSQEIFNASLKDKKIRGDQITLALPEDIGKCTLHRIPVYQLQDFIELGL